MTVTYGLTTDGYVPKPLNVIREEINTALRNAFGVSIDLSDQSFLGQLSGIMAERYALLWDLSQAVNASQDPDAASGAALDGLSLLTGTSRPAATFSTAVLTLTGVPTTSVLTGFQASTSSTHKKFTTTEDVTIAALSAFAAGTPYVVGDRVTNAARAYQCITAGTSGNPGPTSTSADFTDGGGVHWEYLGDGTGAIDATSQATETGATIAVARDISVIETPVGGVQGVINVDDALVGTDVATDEQLRVLRILERAGSGRSTQDAIRAALLKVLDVKSVTVFVNDTDTTDGDGLPPHSIECLVLDGADQDIVDTIFGSVAAGIVTYGTSSGTAVDSEGTDHTISFSRPNEVPIFIDITLTYDASLYPSDGDAEIKLAIVTFGGKFGTGRDVTAAGITGQAFTVPGVLDVTFTAVYNATISTSHPDWAGTTGYTTGNVVVNDNGRRYICITSGTSAGSGGPTGTGTDITDGTAHWRFLGATETMALRDLATFDTAHINVHSSAATP